MTTACVPSLLRPVLGKARHLGQAGADWLARLPETLGHLEHQWSLSIGKPLPGGTAAYVAPVRRADGSFTAQADTPARAEGRGDVKLLDPHDDVPRGENA